MASINKRAVGLGPIVIERGMAEELSFCALALLVQLEAEPQRDVETVADWAREHGLIGVELAIGELVRCGYLQQVETQTTPEHA